MTHRKPCKDVYNHTKTQLLSHLHPHRCDLSNINHPARLTFLLISGLRACCLCVIACWRVSRRGCACFWRQTLLSTCTIAPGLSPDISAGRWKFCLMSSMWPQLERCVVDRRLCPVSDWGLGLVTGPPFLSVGWCPLSLPTLPPSGAEFPVRRSLGSTD